MPVQIIPSPCVGICRIHPIYKTCRGCYRTNLEISIWGKSSDENKRAILNQCAIREKLYGNLTENLQE